MQKRNIFKSLFLLTCLVLFNACSKKPEHLKLIPKDAGIVANIDLLGLGMKIGSIDIESYEFIKDLLEKSKNDSTIKFSNVLNNPLDWGISLTDDIYTYTEKVSGGYTAIALRLTNSENFTKVISDLVKNDLNGELKSISNLSLCQLEDILLTWDNESALILFNLDKSSMTDNELKEKAIELFNIQPENQFYTTNLYNVLSEKKGDINLVVNQSNLYQETSETKELLKDFENICSYGSIHFEDDRIFAQGGTVQNEAFKKYESTFNNIISEYNQEVIKQMPENHLALFGFSFNLEAGIDSITNSLPLKTQMGIAAAKPVLEGFGGSFNLSLYDVEVGEKEIPSYSDTGFTFVKKSIPLPKVALGFDVKKKEALDQVIAPLSMSPFLETTGNYFTIHSKEILRSNFYAYYNDKIGIITTDQNAVEILSEGKSLDRSLADSEFANAFQASNSYFHLHTDLTKYPDVVTSSLIDLMPSLPNAQEYLNVWNTYNKGIEVKIVNKYDYEMSYVFKEKPGNIIENYLQMIDEMYKLNKSNSIL